MKLSESQALHRLAAYCSKAERCESDIRKKMMLWELSDEEKNRIVTRLRQEKFLDENRYAVAFVKDKSRFGKWGRVKIEFELRKKKIPDSLIHSAIQEMDQEGSNQILTDLLIKKNRLVKAQTDYDRRIKLIRYAASKGYLMDDIVRCLNRIVKENDDME